MMHAAYGLGSKLWERQGIALAFGASLALVAAGWLWAHIRLQDLGTPLILHFSSLSGIDRIGTFTDLSAQAFLGVVLVLTNAVIGLALQPRDRFLARIVAASTFAMSCLLFILLAVIISVN